MNALDPLAQLNDIIEAQAITWWPLAIGWWLLIFVGVTVVGATFVFFIKRHQRLRYRKEALLALLDLERRYFKSTPDLTSDTGHRDASRLNAEVNMFLKRILSSQQGSADYRTQTSDAWKQTLDEKLPFLSEQDKDLLASGHYAPVATRLDRAFFESLKKWLKRQR
ncbi:hypothetical protein A3742_03565 [Oleiphilus sp. HI0071]|uniref:DUF4381 domain-containing protein n=3 Tax=unclassified Oleiphilus TaxID=2631174 RepID=UPI0007C220EF|nr:DUF4381 domain-containing protein [Oleiphilus sp. HI0079]KZY63565.1 hypothetical protein A3737_14490 [Oleiphilus sp. HI0065]KZY80522.1 hypothetical protein A3742_20675 [Oleiphilus sp. HI0071]KZY97881.1 hypothetical protein A3744_01520 [Oleiphilus sp. HI0073]KZZ50045.1 hypothetical protein A3760_14445 [Oleiphilus sp. HI0122]KZZ54733.1 hypothetical protein A3758_00320 [Oleiphilus sp. HI0118]KZZ72863.1 hypothetical protein A3765_12875 [Oleiphilus sp. HI0130]KZZ78998.1 hypothetical protein A3